MRTDCRVRVRWVPLVVVCERATSSCTTDNKRSNAAVVLIVTFYMGLYSSSWLKSDCSTPFIKVVQRIKSTGKQALCITVRFDNGRRVHANANEFVVSLVVLLCPMVLLPYLGPEKPHAKPPPCLLSQGIAIGEHGVSSVHASITPTIRRCVVIIWARQMRNKRWCYVYSVSIFLARDNDINTNRCQHVFPREQFVVVLLCGYQFLCSKMSFCC